MAKEFTNPEAYILNRSIERVAGNILFAGIALPALSRAFRIPLRALFARSQVLPPFLADLWLPSSPVAAAVVGAGAGLLEERHARLAWADVFATGRSMEPPLWTGRALAPCLALMLNPLLAIKAIDGEVKGGDAALAALEGRPVRAWPFFAVLDVHRPSSEGFSARFVRHARRHCELQIIQMNSAALFSSYKCRYNYLSLGPVGSSVLSQEASILAHLACCRVWLGFYTVERHPENAKWNIF